MKLNNIINLSDEEVIIMLGKIKVFKHNDDYSSFVSKDWASEMIKGESKWDQKKLKKVI